MTTVIDCIGFSKVDEKTILKIFDCTGCMIASGNWFQDHILDYSNFEVLFMGYDVTLNSLTLVLRDGKLLINYKDKEEV